MGWGSTGADPTATECEVDITSLPNILQETTMRMCSDDEAAAFPVGNNQICAVGTDTSAYAVCTIQNFMICCDITNLKQLELLGSGRSAPLVLVPVPHNVSHNPS